MVVLKALREWQSFFVFSIIISSLSFHSVSAQELEPIDPDAAYSAEVYGPTDGDVEGAEIVLEEPMRPVVRTNGPSELNSRQLMPRPVTWCDPPSKAARLPTAKMT